jgi:hypothetical protein
MVSTYTKEIFIRVTTNSNFLKYGLFEKKYVKLQVWLDVFVFAETI